jgi:4-hydroxybenzoate polyprenyltransferase
MKAIRYSISSLRFWPAFGIHMRPYLLFVSGVAGLSGMALAADFTFWSFSALAAFLAFFLGYGFGQAFTDCFQVDTDRLSSPYRPLSQGIVSPKEVGIVAVCGLLLVSLVLISLNGWNAILCGFSVMGLATYTFFKRNFWFAGPFYNAWIVVLLPLMGFMGMSSQNMAWSSFSYLFPPSCC